MTALPDNYQTVLAQLAWNDARHPDKQFINNVDDGKSITYGAAYRLCNRIAHLFARRGLGAGDRITILSDNCIEYALAYVAVLRFGATVNTVNIEMNDAHLRSILGAVRPRLVLWQEGHDLERFRDASDAEWISLGDWNDTAPAGLFAEAAAAPETPVLEPVNGPEDAGLIIYTSGTADKPKGVIERYLTVFCNTDAIADGIGLTETDRILEYRSLAWYSPQLLGLMPTLMRGATMVMANKFSQSRFFDWLKEHRITIAVGIPTVINMLINRPVGIGAKDLPDLRFITSSSAPLLVEQWEKFEALYGIPIAQSYGSTEGGWAGGCNETTRKIGTVGKPLKHQTMRIVDNDGNEVPKGEAGEIQLSGGRSQAYGYLLEDGSIQVFGDGPWLTGDLGRLDEDGCLVITGRAKDLIIRGGVNISPTEIDNVLLSHPDVAEAATIGVPDAIYGEEVVSYIVPGTVGALTEEAVQTHCADRLPDFRRPKQIIFTAEIPKNTRGKVDRQALRAVWESARPSADR